MALKNDLDAASVGDRLAVWLPGILDVEKVEILGVAMPSESGMSTETVLIETSCDGEPRGLVVRVPPDQGGLFHTYDIGREVRVMSAVGEHTAAPVPRILAHETTGSVLGTEFMLVERVYGQVPGDDPPYVASGWVVDLTAAQRAVMYDEALKAIVAVQQLDPLAAGLEDLKHAEFGDTVAEQEIGYWRHFYEWAAVGRPVPTIDQAFEVLAAELPADDTLVVAWGDSRFGNIMFGPDQKVTALFDWEMAALGRPEVDFGFFLFTDRMYSSGMGIPRLDGFPTRDAAVARFEELSGRPVRDLQWFEAFAGLRGSIMAMRVANKLIEHGMLPEDAAMPFNNPATQSLAEVLDLPAPAGDAGWITGRST